MSSARELHPPFRPTIAEVDLSAFSRNIAAMRALLPEGSGLIAVVKADAYGHGAVPIARSCERSEKVDALAVALLEEALEIRSAGIELPVLVLGPLTAGELAIAREQSLVPAITGPESLEEACSIVRDGGTLTVHLKLDSGMGRMGVIEGELESVIERLRSCPSIRIAAIYSHFANASDPDDDFTHVQTKRFERMLEQLRRSGIEAPLHHLANSAASLRGLVRPGDSVRVGISLYGGEPLEKGVSRLEPVLRWTTRIMRLKDLPEGHAIGYGTTFHTSRPSRIATLPVGYADGYDRLLSNRGQVLVRGRRFPVVGRVSMDLTTIDVTDLGDAAIDDEVVLLGRQGDEEIAAEELAAATDTIPYEVWTRITQRVPRVYRTGKP